MRKVIVHHVLEADEVFEFPEYQFRTESGRIIIRGGNMAKVETYSINLEELVINYRVESYERNFSRYLTIDGVEIY